MERSLQSSHAAIFFATHTLLAFKICKQSTKTPACECVCDYENFTFQNQIHPFICVHLHAFAQKYISVDGDESASQSVGQYKCNRDNSFLKL